MNKKNDDSVNGDFLTRRDVFKAGASVVVAASLGGPVYGSTDAGPLRKANAPENLSLTLATFVAETQYSQLPGQAVIMAKRSILDAVGVSMAATGIEPACQPFLNLAGFAQTENSALILGTGKRAPVVMAALANGALAHALDYEDAHGPSRTHPNAATVAAAISVADGLSNVSGKDFITAVAIGCDLTSRLSLAQGNVNQLPEAFYPPAIVGTFGAVAAASKLLGLSAEQTLNAFSLALCQNSCSAEILFNPYSDIRAVRDAFCAQSGVQAALLAQGGVKGFAQPFDGQAGFFKMYANGQCLADELLRDLGKSFAGSEIGFKAWPACRDTHLFIQAALEGLQADHLDVQQIADIRVAVQQSNMIVCEPAAEKRRPRAAIDAKFSLYFTLASALINGNVDFRSFSSRALTDARILTLADKIHYVLDEAAAKPTAQGGGVLITVTLMDGKKFFWSVKNLFGSPENPMSEEHLLNKFIDCGLVAKKPLNRSQLINVAGDILRLEDVDTLAKITKQL